ncbi:MAG: hypothetical protein UT51_C0011G0003 [Candidatus Nomurabacteria bacterium GW2011_GWC2_39_41]|uniref:Transposase n=2 Tax=Parcubacteria group TaxID=1794811 RepID=A0A0G1SMQ1_9BACT|nr:MAG: hypothetical protein UT51_C0011G0003 [Candidatus Nomurabacteria bacterium GW2011_GWC2_39_41]KKU34555.1 MAG: hypothetical protein UX48_C0031G0003 [Candidatus Azambacteria bacterium GW2011_GWB1_46_27]
MENTGETKEINWIDEMIIREAIPKTLREGSNAEFCQKYGIAESNYYYHSSKTENKKKSLEIAIENAKKYAPEVLENLGERATTDNRAAEMYLKFILQLAEKHELGGKDGSPIIIQIAKEIMEKSDVSNIDTSNHSEG